jgi:hypothetical protein
MALSIFEKKVLLVGRAQIVASRITLSGILALIKYVTGNNYHID